MTSELKHLLIGVVIFLILGLTGVAMMGGVITMNPSLLGNQSGKFTALKTEFSSMNTTLNTMKSTSETGLGNMTTSSGVFGYFDSTFKTVFGTVKTTATGLKFMGAFASDIGGYMDIPDEYKFIFSLGGIILLFIIVWAVIGAIMKSG
jgi:hypothetical protein